jgi:Xaa-Pro aminopeptidase
MNLFSKATYIKRRESLKQKIGSGILLFMGNEESSINFKDNWYPFRQDSSFLYFFGLDLPGLTAIIDIDEGTEVLFGDDVSTEESVWLGSKPSIADLGKTAGIETTRSKSEFNSFLAKVNQRKLRILPQFRPENIQRLEVGLNINSQEVQALASEEFIKAVVGLRSIKSPEEIQEITKAVNISVALHKKVMLEAKPGMKEYELLGKVTGLALSSGGHLSFPPIITTDGQTLHNHQYSNTLTVGKMLLCDCGAESSMHYAGDITRTIPVGHKFSDRQKDIYQIVRNAHQVAIDALKPSEKFIDIHLLACKKLAEGLKAIGLMKGNMDDAVDNGAHALFFPCGLGHMMGLDVHDMEDLGEQYVGYTKEIKKSSQFGLKSLRLGKELRAGHVLTIEPGIYFIPQLIDQWKSKNIHKDYINYDKLDDYRQFGGIRVEDDFVITKNGSELLGEPLEIEIDELEALKR